MPINFKESKMQISDRIFLFFGIDNTAVLVRQMRDYCQVGIDLVMQRQVIFVAALGLAGYYYSVTFALGILLLISCSEAFDFWLFRHVLRRQAHDKHQARQSLLLLCVSTLLSASIIVTYAVGIAVLQGPTTHFMPLFFLFAAALFAAMNNHQLLPALFLRLTLYGSAFLFIPIRDVVLTGDPLGSELWAQLFTSVFVVFFIFDCSRIYLRLYRSQRQQLEALQLEHERSQQAFIAKSEFVSTMSHELRTPLTAIKGSVDLVGSGKLGELPAQATFAMEIARRNSDRLLSLINEILDLQTVENNSMKFDNSPVSLEEVVSEAIAENMPYAARLNIGVNVATTKEEVIVNADKKRLVQVFSNVLSNAEKFSPEGSTIEVSFEPDNETARVLFSDCGTGLSEDDYDKVFEPFTQIDSSDTRRIGGTGLGMNISRRIMDALGGTITYRRNPDIGTTFIVELPRILSVAR
ncbi:MAG: HAMP domain-containing histidine kinase [Octadecabacter sp.]|nr:HAMP domain-containing histidine kinase [Octadecabacter sp.]